MRSWLNTRNASMVTFVRNRMQSVKDVVFGCIMQLIYEMFGSGGTVRRDIFTSQRGFNWRL